MTYGPEGDWRNSFEVIDLTELIPSESDLGSWLDECLMGGQPHEGPCDLRNFCHIHHRHEKDLPGDYQACGECWHVWRVVEEFAVDVMRVRGEDHLRSPEELANETCCPLCTHDF